MNYPIWELPAAGLLIALVAIVHVLVSHFAVGGGLFLVVTERKARREGDATLLAWLQRHTRFFVLLTLVFGALTGVGIWFTIALVNPSATSSLINTFVWGWAIEWTFFVIEIAAAMVYYYGWQRMSPRTHEQVGWIYFGAAWASMIIINGILSYMMTPGDWVRNRSFWSGFFNETYFPSLVLRTFVAMGLAGIYALLTTSWSRDGSLKKKMAVYAGTWWILPMAVAIPLALVWYLVAAATAGVPTAEILGADGPGLGSTIVALFTASGESGYPTAQIAALTSILASAAVIVMVVMILTVRRSTYGWLSTGLVLALSLVAMGGGEWMREDLRKPYVIGGYMFVNGVRLPAPDVVPAPPPEAASQGDDAFAVDRMQTEGLLATARWIRPALETDTSLEPEAVAAARSRRGEALFRLACSGCHTVEGYQGIQPLVQGQSVTALERILGNLALPVDSEGEPVAWSDPDVRLATWRGRRMPPFPGSDEERLDLAIYLARLGGDPRAGMAVETASTDLGRTLYQDYCSICHDPGADWPMAERIRGRDADQLFEVLGRLPEINENMPPFEGSDEERRALATYLVTLDAGGER
ncbi:MAG: c-type cytochrome [Acidobacteriota bacterium]|jgi:mono/diheme cytochrome c family protein